MRAHKIITVSETGTICHYEPPQTTPHKTQQSPPPQLTTNTLPLLTHHKSSLFHPSTKTRLPTPPITTITTYPPLIATGNSEGFITISNPANPDVTIPLHVNAVTDMRFCDAGENIVTSGIDGFVHITRLSNPTKPFCSLRHPLPVTTFVIGYASTSARLITASTDRCTRVFHTASTRLLTTIHHTERVTALAMGPAEDFWWGGCEGSVGRIDISSLPVSGTVHGKHFANREAAVGGMTHAPGAIVVGYSDGVVQMFDTVTNVLLRSFGGGAGIIRVLVQYSDDEDAFPTREVLVGAGGGGRHPMHVWQVLKEFSEDAFDDCAKEADGNIDEVTRLAEEVDRLRKRNRQLEDAGSRLIELVERGR